MVCGQPSVKWMGPRATNMGDIGHWQRQIEVDRTILFDGLCVGQLLVEIIRRHGQNQQATRAIAVVQRLQIIKLPGKPAQRGGIDHQNGFAAPVVQINLPTVDGVE